MVVNVGKVKLIHFYWAKNLVGATDPRRPFSLYCKKWVILELGAGTVGHVSITVIEKLRNIKGKYSETRVRKDFFVGSVPLLPLNGCHGRGSRGVC